MTTRNMLFHMTNPSQNHPVGDLKELIAWQVAMDLAEAVYRATRRFPDDERFGLRLQVRRAAVSVPSNIAEGHGRVDRGDYARHVRIARGSLKEVETQIILSRRLGFFSEKTSSQLLATISRANRLITGLLRRLRQR